MNQFAKSKTSLTDKNQRGQSRIGVLLVSLLCLGLAAAAVLYWRAAQSKKTGNDNLTASPLSESTRTVLNNLRTPVEVHFYSLLDQNSVAESVRDFSARIDRLLTEYERDSGGKLSVIRSASITGNAADSAYADGIRPFNIDKGDACFLGIAVVQNERKESLPRLLPEWESALEADLTRAIVRVSEAPGTQKGAFGSGSKPEPAVIEQVKQMFPNLETLSIEDGKRLLRESALKDFTATAQEMEARLKEVQQRLGAARAGQSEAERQALSKELEQLQTIRVEKLKEIAARSQAQVEALESLKRAETTTAP